MRIEIPDFCLVLLVGASGSGKSHLAKRLFKQDEVLSSDYFRMLVSGDEADQGASEDAFECLYNIAQKRMNRRKLTVIDATNLSKWARKKALDFAKDNNCFCYAIALNLSEDICQQDNEMRQEKQFSKKIIRRQCEEFHHALKSLKKENFRKVFIFNSQDELNSLEIDRIPLWTDKSILHGPFDIIGDIHGCYQELCALLKKLGYLVNEKDFKAVPPQGRKAVFLGDLCDRGPANVAVLKLVMNMQANGQALCVPGNHDDKLSRYLDGKKVQVAHGLELTLAELEREDPSFKKKVKEFFHSLISHYLLDDGKLVVCHAGLPANLQGRSSGYVRDFCLYGDPSGLMDEYGLPERNDWAKDYNGSALVAYGHCPELETKIVNNSICLDSGCVFGGTLTSLRYPEMEIVSVPAEKEYFHSLKPLQKAVDQRQPETQELLKRKRLETSLGITIIRDEERALSALEIMGRFAINPNWLIYLPPTMSPCETSPFPDYLEHPLEAFNYYKKNSVEKVICEEKHMGSRAIVIVCRDEKAAKKHFAALDNQLGIIYTRTGRPFFTSVQAHIQAELLERIASSLSRTNFWQDHDTDWVCLDCELLPWSFKAQTLISSQYAPYGIAGANGVDKSLKLLEKFRARFEGTLLSIEDASSLKNLQLHLEQKQKSLNNYNKVWQSYCGDVCSVKDIKLAPFHILATNKKVWCDTPHDRHLQLIQKYLHEFNNLIITQNRIINLKEDKEINAGLDFWENLLANGAEGMVVKPLHYVSWSGKKLLQPAIKCRGSEYLRIIYGAEYLENIEKFKQRNLAPKRKRALREFALGLEALELFVNGEPLRKIHECVFTILALESEPQDARL